MIVEFDYDFIRLLSIIPWTNLADLPNKLSLRRIETYCDNI